MEMPAADAQKNSGKQPWYFLVMLFLLSWPIWALSGVLARGGTGAYDFRWLIAQVGVSGPSLAALIAAGTVRSELRQDSLRLAPILIAPPGRPFYLVLLANQGQSARCFNAPYIPQGHWKSRAFEFRERRGGLLCLHK